MGRVLVARVEGEDERARATADLVATAAGASAEVAVQPLRLPRRLGDRLRSETRRSAVAQRTLAEAFRHTPEALLQAWRAARWLEVGTEPGDTVVVADRGGLAGIFALEQLAAASAKRRRVVVAAGAGHALELLLAAGTLDGLEAEAASQVDWELVAYRFADAVVATGAAASRLVRELGGQAELLPGGASDAPSSSASPAVAEVARPQPDTVRVAVPGPAARVAQTGAVLRAVAEARAAGADVRVWVGVGDRPDGVWAGSAWDALAGIRGVLGEAAARGQPGTPDAVVIGDPFAPPPDFLMMLRARGVPVAVPAGSAAAWAWPDAATWATPSELAAWLVSGGRPSAAAGAGPAAAGAEPVAAWPPGTGSRLDEEPGRARRVSVAVPVFRDVRFLDAAVGSVLAQDQPVHEVFLVDDGSAHASVDRALDDWAGRDARVQVLRQPNRGVCAARNLALDAMSGDAFVLLDQDDVLEPGFVSACATVLRARPHLDAVATWTEFFGAYEGVEAKPPFDARVGRRENAIVSTAVLVDMGVRDRGLRFTDDLAWLYCEDWDFWARIVAGGGAIGLVPRPLARHRVHAESGGHQRTELALRLGRARATANLPPPRYPRPGV